MLSVAMFPLSISNNLWHLELWPQTDYTHWFSQFVKNLNYILDTVVDPEWARWKQNPALIPTELTD